MGECDLITNLLKKGKKKKGQKDVQVPLTIHAQHSHKPYVIQS